ncbi:MAG: toxin-antitoxin system YwqK family antitoxin [Flavobacteriales bacterium]|nr:toxin-antitoxin system YwqK family antitoxin [Flavobacteriales bacterium]
MAILFCCLHSAIVLCAQSTDTTEVKNGTYWVVQRDAKGIPVNAVVLYDTTGRMVCRGSYRGGLVHGPMIYFDSTGTKTRLVTYKKGKRNGAEYVYYPNGKTQVQSTNRNGWPQGRSTSYYPNGQVEWTKQYRDGKLFGERVLRDSTGALYNGDYLTEYQSGARYTTNCINGRPHGEWNMLRPNGEISYTGHYTNGFPDGEYIYFDNDGKIFRKEYYEMGKFIRSTQRGANGAATPNQYP